MTQQIIKGIEKKKKRKIIFLKGILNLNYKEQERTRMIQLRAVK